MSNPPPSPDEIRRSVQKGVEEVVKPFLKKVKAQRRIPRSVREAKIK